MCGNSQGLGTHSNIGGHLCKPLARHIVVAIGPLVMLLGTCAATYAEISAVSVLGGVVAGSLSCPGALAYTTVPYNWHHVFCKSNAIHIPSHEGSQSDRRASP